MNITGLNVPIAMVAGIIVFTITGVFTIDYRYAISDNVKQSFNELQQEIKQGRLTESINNDRLWIEILDDKAARLPAGAEQDKVLRQIHRLEQSIEVNMGKLE